jgi:Flp pilus assembly protein TadD
MPDRDETRSGEMLNARKTSPERIAAHLGVLIHPLAILFALSLLTAAIYSNAVSASFQLDDTRVIVENPIIKNLKHFFNFSDTRYVADLSFALNYHVGGLAVFGYHVVNILIHLTNGFLVYLLILLLFRASAMVVASHHSPRPVPPDPRAISDVLNGSQGVALFASLLFLAHPIQTEAVTYIVQRFASLAALFYLLTVICYLRGRLSAPTGLRRWGWYGAAFITTVLAMKTKENTFTLPFMLLLIEVVFFGLPTRRGWLSLLLVLLTFCMMPLAHPGLLKAGLPRATMEISRLDYLFTQFRVIVTYLRLLVLPIHQNLDYDYPVFHSLFQLPVFLSFLGLLGLGGGALWLLLRTPAPSPTVRLVAFGVLWFFLTLSIESSIIPLRDVIYEHRLYLPSVGFFMSASAAGFWLYRRVPDRDRWVAICLACSAVALLSVATYQRNMVWRDTLSLWTDVVRKSPGKVRPHDNLGVALRRRGDLEGAIAEYRTALRLNPNHVSTHDNLGVALYTTGDLEGAIAEFRTALRLNPNHVSAHDNLGAALYTKGDLEGAITAYRELLRLVPHDATVRYHLGIALMDQGDVSAAAQEFREFLRLAPSTPSKQQQIDDAKRRLSKLGGESRGVKRGG